MSSIRERPPADRAGLRAAPGMQSSWPLPLRARILLLVLVFASALVLRIASWCVDCTDRRFCRLMPVLVVDPNTAPASVLGVLPHVGPKMVRRLIEQRERRRFESAADLRRRVRGLGPATMRRWRPLLPAELSEFGTPTGRVPGPWWLPSPRGSSRDPAGLEVHGSRAMIGTSRPSLARCTFRYKTPPGAWVLMIHVRLPCT